MFFFNDTATTEIYTLSLHDALPISYPLGGFRRIPHTPGKLCSAGRSPSLLETPRIQELRLDHRSGRGPQPPKRSEEHTSELQSRQYLVCRLLLEKKKIRRCMRLRRT